MANQTSTDLSALSAALSTERIDVRQFVEQSLEVLSKLVDCDRAGVWCISGQAPERILHCVRIYDRTLGRPTRVENMGEPQITTYVDTLLEVGTLEAVDVKTHPATQTLFKSTGLHKGVSSVIAKTSLLNGELLCVFTCAQVSTNASISSRHLSTLNKFSSEFVLAIARNCHPALSILCALPPPDDWDKAC